MSTLVTTLVEGAPLANAAAIGGNVLEATGNDLMKTAGNILQSINIAYIGLWATFVTGFEYAPDFVCKYNSLLEGAVGLIALSLPLVAKYMGKEEQYSTALKVANIAAAGFALSIGLLAGHPIPTLALISVSLLSSAYLLIHKPN